MWFGVAAQRRTFLLSEVDRARVTDSLSAESVAESPFSTGLVRVY